MEKYILPGLIANAATLGIHWIYDYEFIRKLDKEKSVLFRIQDKETYDKASVSFYSYPNHQVGDVTVQGDILKWLYQALKDNPELTKNEYDALLYEHFRPGGSYKGYVETYAKKQVLKHLSKDLDINLPEIPVMDNHLVSFMPYLACKELNLSIEKAWELVQVYTTDEDYLTYFKMLDHLFDLIPNKGLQRAIEIVIDEAPNQYQEALHQAIKMKDTDKFIDTYAGRACAINHSMPVIIHVLYHAKSFENAVHQNALIGGAVSDRNTLIGAIAGHVFQVPDTWEIITKIRFK